MTKFHNRWKHRKGMLLVTAPRFYWVGVHQYRGFTPTAVLHRSYGAFQRRNPPCPAGKTAGKSTVGADG